MSEHNLCRGTCVSTDQAQWCVWARRTPACLTSCSAFIERVRVQGTRRLLICWSQDVKQASTAYAKALGVEPAADAVFELPIAAGSWQRRVTQGKRDTGSACELWGARAI